MVSNNSRQLQILVQWFIGTQHRLYLAKEVAAIIKVKENIKFTESSFKLHK